MERMGTALDLVEEALNAALAGPVADFRAQLRGADLDLFPEFDPVGR